MARPSHTPRVMELLGSPILGHHLLHCPQALLQDMPRNRPSSRSYHQLHRVTHRLSKVSTQMTWTSRLRLLRRTALHPCRRINHRNYQITKPSSLTLWRLTMMSTPTLPLPCLSLSLRLSLSLHQSLRLDLHASRSVTRSPSGHFIVLPVCPRPSLRVQRSPRHLHVLSRRSQSSRERCILLRS